MQDLDVLVDLLDYVKSRWAPGHVPRVGLGLRVHPEQKRDYALAFARSVDAAIARGNGTGRRAAASQTRKQALPSNIAAAPEVRTRPGGAVAPVGGIFRRSRHGDLNDQ